MGTYSAVAKFIASSHSRPAWLRFGMAAVLPFFSLAGTLLISNIRVAPFFPLFNLAVLVSAVMGGATAGFIATFLSALLVSALVPPAGIFQVDPAAFVRIIAFLIVACIISTVIGLIVETQERAEHERQRLSVTLASIGDAVVVTDDAGRVNYMNRVCEDATGWSLSEAVGKPLQNVFPIVNETTRQPVENPVDKVFAQGRIVGLANHTVLLRRDGTEIPIDDSAAPIRDQSGRIAGVVLVFRDISARKQAEAALLRTEKLATVGRLAATIAHEINNPLEAVTNLLFISSNHAQLPPEVKKHLELAQSELARAAHVAKQTLSFYRPLQGTGSTDVTAVIREVLDLYASRISAKSIAVETDIAANVMAIAAGSDLRQVIANIIANAIDATSSGGRLIVRASAREASSTPRVVITIADTGAGIEKKFQPQIFEPFFTTKQNVGTGLGLWVCRQIIDGSDGRIHMRSKLGVGTVFRLSLPGANGTTVSRGA
jgi:PAS domain S-box-containing protein